MAFRDNDLATRARIDALEEELKDLRAENVALKLTNKSPTAGPTPSNTKSSFSKVVLILAAVGVGVLLAAYQYVTPGPAQLVVMMLAAMLLFAAATLSFVSRLIVAVPPGRMLVITGRHHVTPDGQTRGFRVVTSGTTLRLPLLEVCQELQAGPFLVEATLSNLYLRDAGPVNVAFRARLLVAREVPFVINAAQRFAGRDEGEAATVGRETIEGAMRTIAAERTLLDLRERRANAEEELKHLANADLANVGMVLEFFEITDIVAA